MRRGEVPKLQYMMSSTLEILSKDPGIHRESRKTFMLLPRARRSNIARQGEAFVLVMAFRIYIPPRGLVDETIKKYTKKITSFF